MKSQLHDHRLSFGGIRRAGEPGGCWQGLQEVQIQILTEGGGKGTWPRTACRRGQPENRLAE